MILLVEERITSDGFIARLSNDLASLTASTYLGGSKHDPIFGIVLDSTGNVYVTGYTTSTDFPTTTGAYDTSGGDSYGNAFIARLNSDLTKLSASTCLVGLVMIQVILSPSIQAGMSM